MVSSIEIEVLDHGIFKFDEKQIKLFDLEKKIRQDGKKIIGFSCANKILDLHTVINANLKLKPIFFDDTAESFEIIRHTVAHILAQAVMQLYPQVKFSIGPVIENGFFYDFDFGDITISINDLEAIEGEMQKIIDENHKITKEIITREEVIALLKEKDEIYKLYVVENNIKIDDEISLYHQGEFWDLCRGPHLPSTGYIKKKSFKLMKLSGVYWQNDSNNKMLQRIVGVAWTNKDGLTKYLFRLEEAGKRDHRKLGTELGLFHIQDEALGAVFWHEKGYKLYRILQEYIRNKLENNGYFEVKTPIILSQSLWEKSGHWDKFQDNMFIINDDEKSLAVKPMSCPCHVELFKRFIYSYKDLPLRMSEFGMCHRNESSGSLSGLTRVREFTQDDAHIFCTLEQVFDEVIKFYKLLKESYDELGFKEFEVRFSDRPEVRAGDNKTWDQAEKSLMNALKSLSVEWIYNKGEGAFYGPKLEFVLSDALGRKWQCGTLQLDFILPQRLGANYIDHNNNKVVPVMIHRAILGTFERFIGILIEHYAGKFPLWLAPVQVVIITVSEKFNDHAELIYHKAKKAGIRIIFDDANQKISYKVRQFSAEKIPHIWIIGQEEVDRGLISCRILGTTITSSVSVDEGIQKIINIVNNKEDKY